MIHPKVSSAIAVLAIASAAVVNAQAPPKAPAKAPAAKAPAPAPAVAATDVGVAVTFKGKGAVDAAHEILVFLFADPDVGPSSRPLGPPMSIKKSGDPVWFKNVTTNPVYVVAVYDEKDNYDGLSGPPPDGTPFTMLRDGKGGAMQVHPGGKTPVRLTIDGTKRWGATPPPKK